MYMGTKCYLQGLYQNSNTFSYKSPHADPHAPQKTTLYYFICFFYS